MTPKRCGACGDLWGTLTFDAERFIRRRQQPPTIVRCCMSLFAGADLSGGGDGWNDEVSPVRLLALVFSGLSTTGFHVTFASEVAYRLSAGRDTVFLKQGAKVQRTVFALTFRRPGTLLLVDAPMIVQNIFVTCLRVRICPSLLA